MRSKSRRERIKNVAALGLFSLPQSKINRFLTAPSSNETFAIKIRYWIVGIAAFLLASSTVVLNLLAVRFAAFNLGSYFYSRNSILIVALSYGLLLVFANRKNTSNRFVNTISSTVFGIYLIHDSNYLRPIIWKDIFHVSEYQESAYLILYLLVCIIAIFAIGAVIDYIRQKLIERPILHLIEPFLMQFTDKIHSIGNEE